MTSTDTTGMQGGRIAQGAQEGIQQQAGQMPGAQQQAQGLPPTGIQQQLESLNSLYSQVQGASGIGFDPRQQQFAQAQAAGGGNLEMASQPAMGSTSLDQLARNLAQRYGLPIGRGRLVDEQGNFLMTPKQMADASGGAVTMGEAAAIMNQVGQGVAGAQAREANQKSIAALETGLGQVQSRGRGSLAAMQSGFYQDIAGVYQHAVDRGDYEGADFSYWIQKEQLDIQQELMRRQEKLAKKQSRMGAFAGIGLGLAGIFTGNVGLAVGGFSQAAGNAAGTGWF